MSTKGKKNQSVQDFRYPVRDVLPTLLFTPEAWEKLQCYLMISDQEISGFGRVRKYGRNYLVDDIFILPQEVSHTHTEITGESVASLISYMMDRDEDPSEIKLWWHSHVNMGLFWSPTDDDAMETLTVDYMFALVGSQSGNVKVRLDINEPLISFDDLPVGVAFECSRVYQDCLDDIGQNVVARRRRPTKKLKAPQQEEYQEGEELNVDFGGLLETNGYSEP